MDGEFQRITPVHAENTQGAGHIIATALWNQRETQVVGQKGREQLVDRTIASYQGHACTARQRLKPTLRCWHALCHVHGDGLIAGCSPGAHGRNQATGPAAASVGVDD